MRLDRITALGLWVGVLGFGSIALLAWARISTLIPWRLLTNSSGDAYVSADSLEIAVVAGLPLLGNLMVIGETRRVPLAVKLRRLHWLAWAGAIVCAIPIFFVPITASFGLLGLAMLLLPTQLTLLTAVYATLAIHRTRTAPA
jgi:hypothetical protein